MRAKVSFIQPVAMTLALALTVGGCSSNESSLGRIPSEPTVSEEVTSTPSPREVRLKETFIQIQQEREVELTVTALRCGISRYPFDASSVSGSIPRDAPAIAPPGEQFCEAKWTVHRGSLR
jgi:hypothetical protein